MKKLETLGICALAAMIASGGVAAEEGGRTEKADPRLGPEVSRVCFSRNISGWRTVKGEDDVILLERGVNHWYRTELLGACSYRQLRFANSIGISTWPGSGCIRKGDQIIVIDDPINYRCSITRINEWYPDAVAETEDEPENQSEDGPEDQSDEQYN